MSKVDEINKKYEIGQPIFEEFFKLSSKEIKEKVGSVVGKEWFDDHCKDMIEKGEVIKVSVDDVPSKIEICHYDRIEITWLGIWHFPEYSSNICLRKFDEHFKL